MSIFSVMSLFSANVYLFLAVISLYLNHRAALNRTFTLFITALTIWAFANALMLMAPTVADALFWRQVSAVGYCLFYAGLLHFTLVLTRRKFAASWLHLLLYLPACIFIYQATFAGRLSAAYFVRAYDVWVYIPQMKGLFGLGYNVYFSSYTLIVLGLIVTWSIKAKNQWEKKQAKIIMSTTIAAVFISLYTDVYLLFRQQVFPPIGSIVILIPALGVCLAILKYKMLVVTPAYAADHILSIMSEPVIVHGTDGGILFANPAAEQLLGYSGEEFLSLTPETFCNVTMPGFSVRDVETQLKTKAGTVIPVNASSSMIYDDMGQVAGVICVLHDMRSRKAYEAALQAAHDRLEERVEERTAELKQLNEMLEDEIQERLHVEAILRASEEKLRLLTDNMLDMIVQIDTDGKFVYASPSHQDVIGFDPDGMLGKFIFDFIHPDDRMIFQESIQHMNCGREAGTAEIRVRHADGHYLWIETVANCIAGPNGAYSGSVVCGRDITERKLMEEKLSFFSLFDVLTGLYNRNYFEQEMNRMDSGRHEQVGVIVCDVDGLKLINDSMGHEAGDQLLKDAAHIIRRCFRLQDVVARIGGDEFAVLLPDASTGQVEQAIERIKAAVDTYNQDTTSIPISISVGYSVRQSGAETLSGVYRRADDQMYREKLHQSKSVRSSVSQILKRALEARDYVTEGHAARLEVYVVGLAQKLGLPEHSISDLRLFAQFHDIGKVGIMDKILFKPGELTLDEVREMQRHSEIGHRIALSAPDLAPLTDWILKHHEWWNGGGYPFGLKEAEIPLPCRILAIADSYDAMTSDRPYRKAMSRQEAMDELNRFKGIQFDPHLVDIFLSMLDKEYFIKNDDKIR